MARGNRRERIFRDEADRVLFYQTLGEACERTGWRVHASVLMSNHYHLMVETPEANLVGGMRWLQNTYTRRHNCRHRLWGRLFGDRYKAILSEGGSGYYYCSLMDYIHLNPVRAGLLRVTRGESVRDYVWSSVAKGYAVPPRRRPIWPALPLLPARWVDDVAALHSPSPRCSRHNHAHFLPASPAPNPP